MVTYDLSGQAVHPSVLYIPSKWRFYPYWMMMTPYPTGYDDYENPSLRKSQDGFIWEKQAGITDPLVGAPADVGTGGHNSDPCIALSNTNMYFWYRVTTATGTSTIYLKIATDETHWSAAQATNISTNALSPSMQLIDGTWHCWYISLADHTLHHLTSADGITWAEAGECSLVIPGYSNWHLEVQVTDLGYEALISAYPNGGTEGNNTLLFHAVSTDGLDWTISNGNKPVIDVSVGSWDSYEIYKASFYKDDKGYKIWYSARDLTGNWGIGYTEGETITTLIGKAGSEPYLSGGKKILSDLEVNGEIHSHSSGANLTSDANMNLRSGKVTAGSPINLNYSIGGAIQYYAGGTTIKTKINTDGSVEVIDPAAGIILASPDASRWRITVANDGTISGAKL
jgi:hypothetical protein